MEVADLYGDNKKIFNALCLISSCSCNLNCNYCEISKSKESQQYSIDLQKKTIQAFKDGSFLKNVKQTYETLGYDLNDIHGLSLWGQEPTLTLPFLTLHITDWINELPNWDSLFFSTNGGTNPQILYDFILALDKNITHPFNLTIQFSYDGEWSCLNKRGINPNIIKEHLYTLISMLNEKNLFNLKINFSLHGVISFDLIKELINTNNILDYLIDLDKFSYLAFTKIRNKSCSIGPVSLAFQQPYKASMKDGLLLTSFIKQCLSCDKKYNFYFMNPIKSILHNWAGGLNNKDQVFTEEKWKTMLSNSLILEETSLKDFSEGIFCGSYKNELKIMYDGTIIGCQNNIFSTNKEKLNESNSVLKSIKENLIDNNFFLNVISKSSNEEDIKKVFTIFEDSASSFLTTYSSIINTLILLAECGQVDRSYLRDKEKLLKHSLMVFRYNSCFYNHLMTSGSHYLESTRLCRLLCNGVLDLVEEEYNIIESERKYEHRI